MRKVYVGGRIIPVSGSRVELSNTTIPNAITLILENENPRLEKRSCPDYRKYTSNAQSQVGEASSRFKKGPINILIFHLNFAKNTRIEYPAQNKKRIR